MEEFWEIHHQGMKAAMKDMVASGDTSTVEDHLGQQATEGRATMRARMRSLTVGEAKEITSGYEIG